MTETERILIDALQASICGTANPDNMQERADMERVAKDVLKWLSSELSYGAQWQAEDPRLNYVDVQVDKELYELVHGKEGY